MTVIKEFDHIGVTVSDLDVATAFFTSLGLEVEGRGEVRGEFIDTVCGIPDSHTEIVMLRPPGGGTGLELARFLHPDHVPATPGTMSTQVGLRNVCFEVADVRATVEELAGQGYGLIGGIGEYENTWAMAYVRGPDDLIVSITARIG